MTKQERIQAIERIVSKYLTKCVKNNEDITAYFQEGLTTAIEEAIGIDEKKLEYTIYTQNPKVFCPQKGGYIDFHILGKGLEDVVKAISTNKEVIKIKERR